MLIFLCYFIIEDIPFGKRNEEKKEVRQRSIKRVSLHWVQKKMMIFMFYYVLFREMVLP